MASASVAAVPSVVLADPLPRPHNGTVLSVAPLMGAQAAVDASHPRWLHVRVRPPVRGLLKVVKVRPGGSCMPAVPNVPVLHTLLTRLRPLLLT